MKRSEQRDVITKLVFGPVLDDMIPAVLEVMLQCTAAYVDNQLQWLINQFKECETESMSKANREKQQCDTQAKQQLLQRAWSTFFHYIDTVLTQFKADVRHKLKAFVKNELTAKTNGYIYNELQAMRRRAVNTKQPRKKVALNVAIKQVIKDYVDDAAYAVELDMQQDLKRFVYSHVQLGFGNAVKSAAKDFNKWLSRLNNTESSTADERYTEACKHLQQLIAYDTVETRNNFTYATVDDTPLLLNKLKAVYDSKDADFLLEVMQHSSSPQKQPKPTPQSTTTTNSTASGFQFRSLRSTTGAGRGHSKGKGKRKRELTNTTTTAGGGSSASSNTKDIDKENYESDDDDADMIIEEVNDMC
jgi:hypothetical protein